MKRHGSPFASEPGSEAVSRVAGRRSQYSTELGRARSPTPSPSHASTRQAAATLRIVVPTASRKKWTARLNDRVLCVSAWPLIERSPCCGRHDGHRRREYRTPRQEQGAHSFSGEGRYRGRVMTPEAVLPRKFHTTTLLVVEHANGIMHGLRRAMHEPRVLPPAFDLTYCTISRLNAKNRSPVRDPVGRISLRCGGLRSSLGRFWRAARQCQ